MKPIASIVAQAAYGAKLHQNAAHVLGECRAYAPRSLAALGIIGEQATILTSAAEERILDTVHLCESPIEQMMLCALGFMVAEGAACFPPAIHQAESFEPWPAKPVVIIPQFKIARYRLDFLVCIQGADGIRHRLAVECDGREFHDGVRERQRDSERDRYLAAFDIKTVRYTGAWIHRNGHKIADEIAAIIQERAAA